MTTNVFLSSWGFRKSIVWPTSDLRFLIYSIKGQMSNPRSNVWLYGGQKSKLVRFCSKWSQNVPLVKTFSEKNSLPYLRCFVTMVTRQKRLNTIETLLKPIQSWTLTCYQETRHLRYSKLFFYLFSPTRRTFWDHFEQNTTNF